MAKREGRRRLHIVLGTLGGLGCTALMALVLTIYGTPYNSKWWWAMAAILLAIILLPRALAPLIEWVVDGYQSDDGADAKRGT